MAEASGTAETPQVFICYRNEDTPGESGRLYDSLRRRYGEEIFRYVDRSPPGVRFPDYLERTVAAAHLVIVLIGPEWLDMLRQHARNADYVRMEIRTALVHGARVVPMLVRGAGMPAPDALPPDIRELAYLTALSVTDTHWDEDMARLFSIADAVLPRPAPAVPLRRPGRVPAVASIATCLVVAAILAAVAILAVTVVIPWIGTLVSQNQQIDLAPSRGPAGSAVTVDGRGFLPREVVEIRFQATLVGSVNADDKGSFKREITVPSEFAPFHGSQLSVTATGRSSVKTAEASFTIT